MHNVIFINYINYIFQFLMLICVTSSVQVFVLDMSKEISEHDRIKMLSICKSQQTFKMYIIHCVVTHLKTSTHIMNVNNTHIHVKGVQPYMLVPLTYNKQ